MVHIYLEKFDQEISMSEFAEAGNILLSNTSINENEAIGTIIGTISLQDENSNEEDITNFTLALSGSDANSFTIDGDKLKSNEIFDFETKTSYFITIEATDGSKNLTKAFEITIINEIEPESILLSNTTINENEAIETIIGTISIQNENSNEEDITNFTLALSGSDANSFTIDGDKLKSNEIFNFEVKSSYSIIIEATDGSKNLTQAFEITILDVFESGHIFLSNTSINENEAIGTSIGTISIEDLNFIELDVTTFTLTLSGTNANSFTIDGDKLKSNEIFDFETKSSYSIIIEAINDSRNLTQAFEITILNVNEAPTNIFLSNNTIFEKRSIGTIVGFLSTEDIDSTSFTFTLSGTDAGSFNIPNNTTTLRSSERFIYKDKNTYNITINVSDGEFTFSKDFIIRIIIPQKPRQGGILPARFIPDIPDIPIPKPPPEIPIMPPIEDVVNAYIDVDIEQMKETFKFIKKTNYSILGNNTEIKYIIEPEYFLEELAKRISSAYTKYSDFNEKDINKIFQESEYNNDENNTLTNDMMKHISKELFNNFHLTDLFKNYDQLIHYLNDSLQTMVSTDSENIFKDTFMKGHEMTNSYNERDNENNIGHAIIQYMYDSEPLRLGNIYDYIKESYDNDDNVIDIVSIESNNLSLYYSPFDVNDTLHFYLTINANENQKSLVNKEGQITRRYKIILVMKPSEYFKKEDEEIDNFEHMETFVNLEKMGFQEMMKMQNIEVELQKNIIMKTFTKQMQRKSDIYTNKLARDEIEKIYKIQWARKKQKTKQNQLLLAKYLLKNNMVKSGYNKKRIIKRPQPTNTFEVPLPVKENINNKRDYKTSKKNIVGLTFYKKIQAEITGIRR